MTSAKVARKPWRADRSRDIDAEHQALIDAALDRDADALVAAARTHYERTASLIVDATRAERPVATS